jgi:hypothetical protein
MPDRQRIAGWVLTGLVTAVLLIDGLTGLLAPATMAEPMAETGFPLSMLWTVSGAAILAGLLYAMPRTAVLGAILVTGFCGGAIVTHVRIGDVGSPPQLICLAIGIGAWAGLWLRDARVRALLPFS